MYNSNTRKILNNKDAVYSKAEEVNQQVRFIKKHIKNDEMVYVYFQSSQAFQFKNGYNKFHIGKQKAKNNIIFGKTTFSDNDKNAKEVNQILSYPKLYIVTSHIQGPFFQRVENLFQKLRHNGFLELIQYKRDTPLWYFSKKATDCKLDYELSVVNKKKKYGMIKATIRIKNTGKAYLNDPYTQTYLVNTINNDIYPLNRLIAPNESIDIVVYYNKNQKSSFTLRKQFGKICKEKILSN